MAFSKGRSEWKSELDQLLSGHKSAIIILNQAKKTKEQECKAELDAINANQSISLDEKKTLCRPYEDFLIDADESDIRIRNSLLIGIFSIWELTVNSLLEHYNICKNPKTNRFDAYFTTIFGSSYPPIIDTVNRDIRELRNYITHNSLPKEREEIINILLGTHPEFDIKKCNDKYFISSYEGLQAILNHVDRALCTIEKTVEE